MIKIFLLNQEEILTNQYTKLCFLFVYSLLQTIFCLEPTSVHAIQT